MNTDAPWPDLYEAESRVLKIQAKLHQWATDSPGRRFDDLFNLVADPAFRAERWEKVRSWPGSWRAQLGQGSLMRVHSLSVVLLAGEVRAFVRAQYRRGAGRAEVPMAFGRWLCGLSCP